MRHICPCLPVAQEVPSPASQARAVPACRSGWPRHLQAHASGTHPATLAGHCNPSHSLSRDPCSREGVFTGHPHSPQGCGPAAAGRRRLLHGVKGPRAGQQVPRPVLCHLGLRILGALRASPAEETTSLACLAGLEVGFCHSCGNPRSHRSQRVQILPGADGRDRLWRGATRTWCCQGGGGGKGGSRLTPRRGRVPGARPGSSLSLDAPGGAGRLSGVAGPAVPGPGGLGAPGPPQSA